MIVWAKHIGTRMSQGVLGTSLGWLTSGLVNELAWYLIISSPNPESPCVAFLEGICFEADSTVTFTISFTARDNNNRFMKDLEISWDVGGNRFYPTI